MSDKRDHAAFDPYHIDRPAPALLTYYALMSLLSGPGFPFVFVPLVCKYLTLRYHFDDKGVSMRYGVLFRREVLLTYRRIQDIHLTHNIVQRWLGLATVSVQTASGSSGAEMAIEGVLEADALRDFLYQQMRGARGLDAPAATHVSGHAAEPAAAVSEPPDDEALRLLREIRDALVKRHPAGEGPP